MAPRPWRNALATDTLRKQINELAPKRSKASDGTIGDEKHQSRASDHNPWVKDSKGQGVVTALDITNDPANGIRSRKLAEAIVASRDKRVKYIISEGQIISGSDGPSPWAWRKYTGKNSHHKHVHISVKSTPGYYDDPRPWDLSAFGDAAPDKDAEPVKEYPFLKKGDKGKDVKRLQEALLKAGQKLPRFGADGDFGDETDLAVRAFQRAKGLHVDGKVGQATWPLLEG